jgi:hypothetical protein
LPAQQAPQRDAAHFGDPRQNIPLKTENQENRISRHILLSIKKDAGNQENTALPFIAASMQSLLQRSEKCAYDIVALNF